MAFSENDFRTNQLDAVLAGVGNQIRTKLGNPDEEDLEDTLIPETWDLSAGKDEKGDFVRGQHYQDDGYDSEFYFYPGTGELNTKISYSTTEWDTTYLN